MQKLIKNFNYLYSKLKNNDESFWDGLEEQLVLSDVNAETASTILNEVKDEAARERINHPEGIKNILKAQIAGMLNSSDSSLKLAKQGPTVYLIVGVNGVGKTTTAAKIANMFKKKGQSIIMAAADTYRAAAVEQLQHFADALGIEMVHHQRNSDPGAVVYDSIEKAQAKNHDMIIVDTAGRMQTSYNLMEELKKIKRVVNKKLGRDPEEILMVIDATTGQNARFQAKTFNEALDLTGIILTKADGTSKGGIVLSIKNELKLPVKLVTNGEKLEHIYCFDSGEFVDILIP
ncbi:MAG: signal recognition particle-docking protein FtsY [Actinomycetota bacterium]